VRIGIQTWGSEGDIRPFIALAGGLRSAGHEVTLVITNIDDKDFSDFASLLEIDIKHVATPVIRGSRELDDIGWSCIYAKNPVKEIAIIFEKVFAPAVEEMYMAAQDLCHRNELVISHFFNYPVKVAAQKLNTSHVSVTLAPNAIFSRYTCPVGFPDLGSWVNPVWWWIGRKVLNWMFLSKVNQLRDAASLSSVSDLMSDAWTSSELDLVAVSSALCKKQKDWVKHRHICGFLNLVENIVKWEMPDDLKAFLDSEDKPIFITFGSVFPRKIEHVMETVKLLRKAVHLAECRAIIQVSEQDVQKMTPDSQIYYTSFLPYNRAFSSCSAVIHHGGVGTTQMSLLSGVPSIVVAHIADQLFCGRELFRKGVAPKVLLRRTLTPEKLANGIQIVTNSVHMKENARKIRKLMQRENGVQRAVEIIEGKYQD
jgi:UDP:flavonoid glycosyltransferase YjiC (YdhE family)